MRTTGIFSAEYIRTVLGLPQVVAAKDRLTRQVQFTIPATEELRTALAPLGLDITQPTIPMRWIKGDTPLHIDSGPSAFENTFLVYLTDSPGEFVLGDSAFPIAENTAFVFPEGIRHETQGTGSVPRLLLGPMNEFAQPVGATAATYYSNFTDASTQTGIPLWSGDYFITTISGITSWRIGSWTGVGAPPDGVYSTDYDLSTLGFYSYFLYPAAPCLLEGTTVLCHKDGKDTYVPIETILPGTLVVTPTGNKRVELIGKGSVFNRGDSERVQDRLYRCSQRNYPQLTEDLFLTGCHSILVPTLTDTQRRKTQDILNDIFITGDKYRLLACIDERAEPWVSEGTYTIWHLAVEDANPTKNHGIYVNGGLLVETCCLKRMKTNSNLVLQ
jgi:hypothetical protein